MLMEKSVKITGMILGTVILLALIGVMFGSQFVSSNTINTNGLSVVKAVPDLVTLSFFVETRGKTATEAKDANAVIIDRLTASLVAAGFNKEDIKTSGYNIYEDFDYSGNVRKSLGYKATHYLTLQIPTSEKDMIGKAIDAGVDSGALLSYINFELSQDLENQYKAEALKLASEDARTKAEAIATGFGKKLGNIVSISDSSFGYSPWRYYESDMALSGAANSQMAKEAATSINPDEQEISGSVSVVYKLR